MTNNKIVELETNSFEEELSDADLMAVGIRKLVN